MKKSNLLIVLPLVVVFTLMQRLSFAGEFTHQRQLTFSKDTITKENRNASNVDSVNIDSSTIRKIAARNILKYLNVVDTNVSYISWRLNPITFDLETSQSVDTSIFFPHLFIPTQNRFETVTSLGNIGAPLQSDHFFSRDRNFDFLFSRNYENYLSNSIEQKHYFLRKPLTLLSYTSGGGSSKAEQTVSVLHSQNVNKHFNLGLKYEHFGTKGMYKNQTTKDNFFTLFGSYYKDRLSIQGSASYSRIRNKENGGLTSDFFIQDTSLDAQIIPFKLTGASSEIKKKNFSAIVGYAFLNRWAKDKDSKGKDILVRKPVFTLKAIFDASMQTRTYTDTTTTYYKNYYINKGNTHDSAMILLYQTTILGEFEQLAKFPGLPGLRFWITNTSGKYYYFKPSDFLFERKDDRLNTSNVGGGIFSYSSYLSYSGSIRMFLDGYKSADKELQGYMIISPWKSEEYPYIKAKIEILDKEPDLFIKKYYSNHFKWNNSFEKEKSIMLGGIIGADKWRFEVGYNIVRINNYVYFDTVAIPKQASGVTITSAYVQKEFKLGHFYSTNRVVWQAYDNKDVINLPTLSVFSALFFEYELVKNVLNARIGANVFLKTKFYADAYSPATGQFYNQKVKEIGDYPVVDLFADFKWKRAILFLKFEHINQGMPNNEYFSALHYPLNRRIFKFGVSWIFYD